MIRLFKHYIPYPVIFLGILDFILLALAAELGWILRASQIGIDWGAVYDRPGPILSFAIALQLGLIAVGVYGNESLQSLRFATARILVAISLGVIFLSERAYIIKLRQLSYLFFIVDRLFCGKIGTLTNQ